jgi:hypothetical protein
VLVLEPVAREICDRYYAEYADEEARYGPRGEAWCVHDNQHIVNWAALDMCELADFDGQLAWLGRLLHARDFPMDRYVRNVEIASEVVREQGSAYEPLGDRLASAARAFVPPE